MIRRVCIYGGPGSGKSRLAARVFAHLLKYKVAHVTEFIKDWAILGIEPQGEDQHLIFASQKSREDTLLRKADFIVTDSPILLNVCYSCFYGYHGSQELISLAQKFEQKHHALSFFIDRTVPYERFGRYQDQKQAQDFDDYLLGFLGKHMVAELHHVTVDDFDAIINKIEENVSGYLA
jgi:nicotinamide riboside kinase